VPKSNAKDSLWAALEKLSPFYKWIIVLFLVSVYAISFPWMFEQLGDFSRLLMILFVIPVILFWGLKGGVIIALLSILAMIAFYRISGETFSGGAIGPLVLFVIVIFIGRMRDLSLQVEAELRNKNQAEMELIKHQANLEKTVQERTLALSKANRELHAEISERKLAGAALRESEEKYRLVVENANEVITIMQDGKFKFANSNVFNLSGYSHQELMSKPFLEFVHPDDQQMVKQHHLKRLRGEEHPEIYVFRIILKNGDVRYLENNGVIITWEGKPATLNFLTDITERRQVAAALKNAKSQWEKTFDAVWDWVSIIDQNHKIIRSNKAVENFIQLRPDQVIGKSCYQIVHGMDCPILDCPLKRSVQTRQRENMEIQLDNGRWVLISVDPFKHDTSDRLFVHIVRDITDIKTREMEILDARKAEAFSVLSGGIAHDYNNLLSVIWGNISLLKEETAGDLQKELFEEAEKACDQARMLTHQFITLSKGAFFKKIPHSIEDVVNTCIQKTRHTKGIDISTRFTGTLPAIDVDPGQLEIAFQAIIQNSLDALSREGRLEIQAEMEPFIHNDQTRLKRIKISFKDNGDGIPESDLANVFDPYFTTKEMGAHKGSGLGLAVSKAIIKKHGGDIQINSIPGQGTSVVVSLPMPDSALKL